MKIDVNVAIKGRGKGRAPQVPDYSKPPIAVDDQGGILRDEFGNPVHPTRDMTFADVAVAAIDHAEQEERPAAGPMGARGAPPQTVDPREFRRRSGLADRIADAAEPIEIDLADRAMLLKLIARRFPSPLFVGRAWSILDPDEELTDTGEAPPPAKG